MGGGGGESGPLRGVWKWWVDSMDDKEVGWGEVWCGKEAPYMSEKIWVDRGIMAGCGCGVQVTWNWRRQCSCHWVVCYRGRIWDVVPPVCVWSHPGSGRGLWQIGHYGNREGNWKAGIWKVNVAIVSRVKMQWEPVGGAPDVGGKQLDKGGQDRIKTWGAEFSGAPAGGNNGSAEADLFLKLGQGVKRVEDLDYRFVTRSPDHY